MQHALRGRGTPHYALYRYVPRDRDDLILKFSILNASINSSGASPPGNRGAFAHVVSPGGEVFAILSRPGGWALAYSWASPGHDTRDEFIGKDEAFVKNWLVRQGLEKRVDIF